MARVVVLGGGVAGMSAAQELAERGFDVVVLERRDLPGGKARSIDVAPPRSGTSFQRLLPGTASLLSVPGEHGFRFFPAFYRHVIDTMRRIPTQRGRSVADALVSTRRVLFTQYLQPEFELPADFPVSPTDFITVVQDLLLAFSPVTGLTPDDVAHYGARVWQLLTSCPERRLAEYERIGWWDFVDGEGRSPAYQKFLAAGITRTLVAARAKLASARTMGDILIQIVQPILDPAGGSTDRVLDGPTNLVWIEPWLRWIESLGVVYRMGVEVTRIRCDRGRITGVEVRDGTRAELVEGDHYVCAVPVERAAPLMNPDILAAAPSLAGLTSLAESTEWMDGVQFYLRRDVPLAAGHAIHIDTEWALTSISQFQFWRPDVVDRYAGLGVNGVISVDVSNWEAPGLSGRPAIECTVEQVAAEVWQQLKRSLNGKGNGDILRDSDLCGWFLDPDIEPDPNRAGRLRDLEPLLVNAANTWELRPDAVTAIPNLFLAADYVRTYTDIATMEGANEAARRAVNGILEAEGHPGPRCAIWPLEEPTVLEPLRAYDLARFHLGMPWDPRLVDVAAAGMRPTAPVLATVPELMTQVEPVVPPLGAVKSAIPVGPDTVLDEAGDAILRGVGVVPATIPLTMAGDDHDGPAGFLERLGWYRMRTLDTLLEVLPPKEPGRHLYDLARDFVGQPSKGLRPALCLATCRAYGGSTKAALPSAAGLELLHNAFLVHDDIEDGSPSRRGRPAMHRHVGIPLAVNTGDAMNALSMRLFRENLGLLPPEVALQIIDEVDHLLVESLEGQAMELGWIRDNRCDITTDDYLRMVLKKTAWYSFIHPMRIGALAADAGGDLDRFNRFGFLLGAAFQIQDDVLNLVGNAARYGKVIGGDLSEGKRTLVLTHAFAHAGPTARSRLQDFLSRSGGQRLPRELAGIHDLLYGTGSIEWARRSAATLTGAARRELPAAFAGAREGPDLDFVRSLVEYVVERDL